MATVNSEKEPDGLLVGVGVSVKSGQKSLVSDVSIKIHAGEIVGLIGPNGAGKSTLLAALAGLNSKRQGEVLLEGKAIDKYSPGERAQRIGWMEQFAASHWPVSAEHLVTLGRLPYLSRWQGPGPEDQVIIERAMQATDCLAFRQQSVNTLSGGELTRVMLARVLASEPLIILADEPVAALDIGHQLQTMEQLTTYANNDRGCLVVLHDLALAARYCSRLYLMNASRIVAEGLPAEVLSRENLRDVYAVELESTGDENPFVIPVSRSVK